jgi:pyruvate,orthophosphate dikinase
VSGAERYVYDFDEQAPGGRELLGGKGIGLAEMTALGVPVPAGFTVTTDACRAYMRAGREVPAGLEDEVERHIGALEEKSGKRFGDPDDPLLVSVRSGAAVSMPGMMDTILNLGLNDAAAEGLAKSTGNARMAYDSYRRLIQMYGEVVDGIDADRFESALSDLKRARGVDLDVDLTADDLEGLIATFKEIYESGTGRGYWDSPEMDKLIAQQRAETDPAKRNKIIADIWKLSQDNMVLAPLYVEYHSYGMRSNVDWKPRPDERLLFGSASVR